MFFGFYFTYKLISLAISFLFVFSVTFGSTLLGVAEKVFWGAPSLLATCTCCFAPQTEATHLTVVVKKKSIDTQPLCLSWHIGMWVSPIVACSFSSVCCVLALQRSCLVQLEHLYSGPSFSLCCPPPQHPVQTEPAPCPTFHSLL